MQLMQTAGILGSRVCGDGIASILWVWNPTSGGLPVETSGEKLGNSDFDKTET